MTAKILFRSFAVVAFLGISLGVAEAQILPVWTHVASAGTVDETSLDLVRLVQGEATLLPTVSPPAIAMIRYNVVAVEGLFANLTPTSYPAVGIRYRDNGADARVIATLKSYDYTTGITSTVAAFDSILYAESASYQTRTFGNCANFTAFDFTTKAYFVEVQLVKSGGRGDPGVGIVFANRYGVCPTL